MNMAWLVIATRLTRGFISYSSRVNLGRGKTLAHHEHDRFGSGAAWPEPFQIRMQPAFWSPPVRGYQKSRTRAVHFRRAEREKSLLAATGTERNITECCLHLTNRTS